MTGGAAIAVFALLALVLALAFAASLYWAGGRGKGALALAIAVPFVMAALYATVWLQAVFKEIAAQNIASPRDMPRLYALAFGSSAATGHSAGKVDPNAMVQQLADHLKDHPDDMEGWLMLARSCTVLGRYAEAEDAYAHAQTRVMQDSDLIVSWVELRVMLGGRKFDARSNELLAQAAKLSPDNPEVMLLRALAAIDRGDKAAADALVDQLHARFAPGTPDRENVDAVLEKWTTPPAGTTANPHPPAAPASSATPAMPDPAAMVQRLADRLKEHPEDMDGWLTLARSYAVLGRPAEAADAYEHAQARALQDSNALAIWIEMRLRANHMRFDARTDELLAAATKLAPDDPDILLLRALAAHKRGEQAEADAIIGKLQAQFPPGTPERQNLDAALQQWMPDRAPAKP